MVTNQVNTVIRRLWGKTPIVEGKRDLRVFIQPCDLKGAKQKDASNCVFARACRRIFGAKIVAFFKEVAYVELPDDKGVRHVERYTMTKGMRDLVINFDRGNKTIPEGGFTLKAISKAQRLDVMAAYRKKRNKAILLGKLVVKRKPIGGVKPIIQDMTVRNGRGLVQMMKA